MGLTPLHLALGVTDGDLSMALVRRACAEGTLEHDNLDWKQRLPLTAPRGSETGRDEQQAELAKDIAAMANTRGGLLVYGVDQDRTRGSSAATRICSVGRPDEATLQDIRRVASSLIDPPVTQLTFTWIQDEDTDPVVLALQVARSLDAPHIVRPRRQPRGSGFWFAVPYRNGADTEWMPEKMIESAYRNRFINRSQREEDLQQKYADLTSTATSAAGGAWVLAVARPQDPLPFRPRQLDQSTADGVFQQAWGRCAGLGQLLTTTISAEFILGDVRSRPGLRRFSQTGSQLPRPVHGHEAHIRVIAELYFDGSVSLALTRGGYFGEYEVPDSRFVATIDLEQVALNLYMLARQATIQLGVAGDYDVIVGVEPADPTLLRHATQGLGIFESFREDHQIGRFRPITGTFLFSQGQATAWETLLDISDDLSGQARTVSLLRARQPATPGTS